MFLQSWSSILYARPVAVTGAWTKLHLLLQPRDVPDTVFPDTGQKKIITGHRILTRYSWIPTISLLETEHF